MQVEAIEYVYFDDNHECIMAKVRWQGHNPRTARPWRVSREPISCFANQPGQLLASDAWAIFKRSAEYRHYKGVYPEEFDIDNILRFNRNEDGQETDDEEEETQQNKRAKITVMDVMTVWEIAKEETFQSQAEQEECPVCYANFKNDTFVSVLPCRHVLCPTCYKKWPRCIVC